METQQQLIESLKSQLEKETSKLQTTLQESKETEDKIFQQQLYNQKLMLTLKQKENITKQLEEKIQVCMEGGTDRLASLDTMNDAYLESIEVELNQIELDVMSSGDLSKLIVILNGQIQRVNEERDRRTVFIQTRIERLENKM